MAANQRPRSALILNIQQENRHIRELQQENRELRSLLEEHQSTLELIMTKYRQQVTKLVQTNKVEEACIKLDNSKVKEFSSQNFFFNLNQLFLTNKNRTCKIALTKFAKWPQS